MKSKMNNITKQIIGWTIIAIMVLMTIVLIKRLPPIMKLLMLSADVLVSHLVYNNLIKRKQTNKQKTKTND